MIQNYRWNVADHAAGYDASAASVHPYYTELQEAILAQIDRPEDDDFLLVDLGGGSGRLVEKFLMRFKNARAVIVDQSEAFLEIAAARLAPLGGRGSWVVARLQDDWRSRLPGAPAVVVSMSAIHHLDSQEKLRVYRQSYDALQPLGLLLNGDEIRDPDDGVYLEAMKTWVAHMKKVVAAGLVHDAMHPMLAQWEERNTLNFSQPRVSGDDCHDTIETQLEYFSQCGFGSVSVPWQRQMWALLKAVK